MIQQGKFHRSYIFKSVSRFVFTMAILLAGTLFGQQVFAQNYSISIDIVGNGSVERTPSTGTYPAGTLVGLEAIADAGWSFGSWTDTDSDSNPISSITVNSDTTITVTFTQDSYTLTVDVTGDGCSVNLNPAGGTYLSGTVVTLTPVAALGWSFSGWSDDLGGSDDPETITMDGDKTVSALFTEDLYPLNITVVGSGGSVTLTPSGGSYTYNTLVTLTPVAITGWTFEGWSVGLSGNSNPAFITMDGPKSVTATFTQNSYTLSLSVTPSGSGAASQDPVGPTHLSGTEVDITATPTAGWAFTGWSGNFSSVLNPATVTMDDNKLVTANFLQNAYQLNVITDGTPGATVIPDGIVMVAHGDPTVIIANVPVGYQFKEWSVTGGAGAAGVTFGNKNLATTTVTLTTGAATVEAAYELKQYKLTLITDGTAGAAVSPATFVMVTHGEPQVISAVPPAGYKLKKWVPISGNGAIIANDTLEITTVTLNLEDVIIQATFELKQYKLTLVTDGTPGATVSPAAPVMVTHGQPQIISVVTIPTGYDFKSWDVVSGVITLGNDTMATTTATLTTEDVILRATFELKQYTLSLQTDGTPGAAVSPLLPVLVDHGVPQLIAATTIPTGYKFKNWTLFSGSAQFGNDTMATTTATLTLGNATVQANFQKELEIVDVKIPNVTMKIGDVVTATMNVSDDAGAPYILVTGSIAGYPLVNLQRLNPTTYLASFTITAGGSSYPALEDIPVVNLILSDGIIQNTPYNKPIVQNNDALDAKLPVINTMTVASSIVKVGDIVILNINADSTNYTAHPLTTINGIPVTAPNIAFVEVGNGDYRLIYTVLEGDNDVPAGQLAASVMLVKPSGNFNVIPFSVISPNTLRIDANAPVITRMEVSQTEVGVGQTVQLVITADGLGYSGGLGTVINGVPLSSDRVSMEEQAGGLYVLNYLVALDDNNVLPGGLSASVVMSDSAGNNSAPNFTIVANTLEVYTDPPVAALAAPPEICEGEPAELTVFLSGRGPWGFDLNDGTIVTSYKFITEATYKIPITPEITTTFKIDSVWDKNSVVNTGAGSVQVIVYQKEDLQIINLASGYSIETEPFRLMAVPTGGDFSGPGVVPSTKMFYPAVAGTENSPHTIFYTLVNSHGCTSVDSALVFVLSAEGDIFLPDTAFCNNSDPFTVTASNLAGATGQFSLTNMNNNTVAGLSDNGDNTALVQPALMQEGKYIIIYEYMDNIPLFLRDTFSIKAIEVPTILNLKSEYCQNEDHFKLESSVDDAIFSGPGVSGNITDGYVFSADSVNPGIITIECTSPSTNGCIAIAQKAVTIKFAPEVGFELSTACISDEGGMLSFENTTSNKLLVETWEWNFGDPDSGDDNTSDLINPTHFYSVPSARIISLTASTFEGCAVTHVMDTVIGNMPVADFTWKTNCDPGESGTVFFNRSISESSPLIGTKWIFKGIDGTVIEDIVSDTHLDSVTYAFGSLGDYIVELLVESGLGCTDTATKEFTLRETFTPPATGYSEGFNASQGLWTIESETQNASWVWDEPDFNGFVPSPGDKAWVTHLPEGAIGYLEHSWIQSPCFDLSGMEHPLIQMDIMKSFVPNKNGAVVQYMDVVEEGWKTIGENTPGIEWYNLTDITNKPGGSSVGWGLEVFNPDNNWITTAHDMDALAGKPHVSFRVAIVTEGAEGSGNQGFAFDNIFIAERSKRAVLEHFTNSSDAASAAADVVVDAFGKENSSDIIDIQYHTDYPGTDPMNENNPDPSSTRVFNYGIPKVPYAILDGGVSEEFRYDFTDLKTTPNEDNMKQLTLQVPKFDVDLEVIWLDQIMEATTSVTCNVDHYAENIQLYVVVFETSVNAYTGINGDTAFRNVVLDMLPTPAGKLLGDNWSKGNNDTRVNTWIYQPYVEDIDDLAVVAFVQDRNSKQILQAAVQFKTPQVGIGKKPFQMDALRIYPNPARDLVNVNLGRPSERDGRFEIIDMNGRIVRNEHVPTGYQVYQLDIHSLNRGFYMIQWYEDGALKGRSKLVKVD